MAVIAYIHSHAKLFRQSESNAPDQVPLGQLHRRFCHRRNDGDVADRSAFVLRGCSQIY